MQTPWRHVAAEPVREEPRLGALLVGALAQLVVVAGGAGALLALEVGYFRRNHDDGLGFGFIGLPLLVLGVLLLIGVTVPVAGFAAGLAQRRYDRLTAAACAAGSVAAPLVAGVVVVLCFRAGVRGEQLVAVGAAAWIAGHVAVAALAARLGRSDVDV
jgi:hypothetical protein